MLGALAIARLVVVSGLLVQPAPDASAEEAPPVSEEAPPSPDAPSSDAPSSDAPGPVAPSPDEPSPDAPSIGTLPLRIDADLAAPDRAEVAGRFSLGLQRSGFDARPVRAKGADTCEDPACYRELATATEVRHLAGATIGREGPDYTIRAYVVSADTGEVVGDAEGICEICGVQELGDMVEGLAARLRAKVDTSDVPTRLRVDTDPPGATVSVDGQEVGTTPLEVEVEPGPHEIQVQRRGYRTESTTAELAPGTTGAYSYRLARSTRIPQWLPWTALAVGVGATAAGVTLVAIDGRPIERDCNEDIMGNCEFLHDTLAGGIALTVTGVALVGTGIALAIVRQRRSEAPRVQAGAWLTSPGVTISGRF